MDTIYVKLKEKERMQLFTQIKNNISPSWETFYPKLKISRSTFFNYLSGRYDIPKERFLKLKNIAGIDIKDIAELDKQKYLRRRIKTPQMNNSLAEILGILNGDGHVNNNEVCVVGSILERDYYVYIKNLFEKCFSTKFTIQTQNTKLKLRIYSRDLVKFLNKKYGLPTGNKLGKLKIPKDIFNKEEWIRSYIRGLFDTDGSIYKRRKRDLVINISNADKKFLNQVNVALNILGLKSSISRKDLYIYRKYDVSKFFKIIKPANSKHLKRYEIFQNQAPVV